MRISDWSSDVCSSDLIFAALADPTRLRIMTLLRSMELSVGELAQVLGQSQPRVSRHLKILADAGLVDRRKEGAWTFVALGREQRVKPALAAIDLWGEDEPERDRKSTRLNSSH